MTFTKPWSPPPQSTASLKRLAFETMSNKTLAHARKLLLEPHGSESALEFLEARAGECNEINQDPTIWACIAHLREKNGDGQGAEEALALAQSLKMSQAEMYQGQVLEMRQRRVRKMEMGLRKKLAGVGERRRKCELLIREMGKVEAMVGEKRERLMARSRRLREMSKGILDAVEEGEQVATGGL